MPTSSHSTKHKERARPFWKRKKLKEMSTKEWESLCDGCGRCCVHKYEAVETGELFESRYACELLDCTTCRCSDYPNRMKRVKNCKSLTPDLVGKLSWLPETCAYRLLDEGQDLPSWHPLRTGRADSVHEAGVSVSGRVAPMPQIEAMVRMAADLKFSERMQKMEKRILPPV